MLEVNNLKKYFPVKKGFLNTKSFGVIRAVDDVSFKVKEGEVTGLVGESGCGKSTIARLILCLLPPTGGEVIFEDKEIFKLKKEELRKIRRKMQIIFQDPYASLNPRMKVEGIISEPLQIFEKGLSTKERREKVVELLIKVGLSAQDINKYPHEFSGGQRQRIGIARAIALNPKLLIADEPVSALDVSIQAQIINLLLDLKDEFHLTYLFISHDLSLVKQISQEVMVMYLGKIVEKAKSDELYNNPLHPYTKALIAAIPAPNPQIKKEQKILESDVPLGFEIPSGCRFHPRCAYVMRRCKLEEPPLLDLTSDHAVACFLHY